MPFGLRLDKPGGAKLNDDLRLKFFFPFNIYVSQPPILARRVGHWPSKGGRQAQFSASGLRRSRFTVRPGRPSPRTVGWKPAEERPAHPDQILIEKTLSRGSFFSSRSQALSNSSAVSQHPLLQPQCDARATLVHPAVKHFNLRVNAVHRSIDLRNCRAVMA